jgi:hypothetical protein
MPAPALGYGKPTEASIDQVNIWMRSTPWYQQLLKQWGHDPAHPGDLTKAQRDQLLRTAQAQGVVVDQGDMEIDTHGNFNPKGHKLRNTLIVAGIAGATLATMGAAGAFAGAAGAGAGAGAGGGTLASSAIGSGAIGGITGGTGLAAGTGGALASTAIGSGAIAPIVGGTGLTAGGAGVGSTLLSGAGRFAGSPQGANLLTNVFGTIYGTHAQGAAGRAQLEYLQRKDEQERQDKLAADAEARRQFDQTQALNLEQYNQREARLAPFRSTGTGANATLASWLGLPASTAYTPAQMPGSAPAATAPPVDLSEAQAKFNALFPDERLTPEMVKAKEAELKAAGFTLRPNAAGVVGKIQYGSGPIIDIIQGAQSGVNKKQWLLPQATAPAAGGSAGPQPFAPRFTADLRATPATLGGMLDIAPAASVDPTTLYALLNTPRRRSAVL